MTACMMGHIRLLTTEKAELCVNASQSMQSAVRSDSALPRWKTIQ